MNMITEIDDHAHLYELLPTACLNACHCSGDNYDACFFWVEKLGLNIPREQCIEILKETGSWEDEELEDDSDKELNIKLLWIAAGYGG